MLHVDIKGISGTVLLVVVLFSVKGSSEFQITTDPHDQYGPVIYQDIVVWTDNRNGNWDIYGYNLSTEEEFQITTDESDQFMPAIYGNVIVWIDERNGYSDVYGYNLLTGEEFQITTIPGGQRNPAIYQNIVVWTDHRDRDGNSDIYGYNLLTGEEFQVTTDLEEQEDPAIYKDIIVWKDERKGIADIIYGYNLSTKEEVQVSPDRLFSFLRSVQTNPTIYGSVVVWVEGLDYSIYSYDLTTSKKTKIAAAQKKQCREAVCRGCYPAIYGDIVVWEDYSKSNHDIYGYNISTGQEFQITTDKSHQYRPAIYEDIVVWSDERNGNLDIYGYDLSTGPPVTISSVVPEILYGVLVLLGIAFLVFIIRKKTKNRKVD